MISQLLAQPAFLPAMVVAIAAGGLLMLGLLTALDAIEERQRNAQAKPPRAVPTNSWGPGSHGRSARADLRSAPR